MGKPVTKIADDVLGIKLMPEIRVPEMPRMPEAPDPREDIKSLPDESALRVAKERMEQMKRRRGRQSLRQDLAVDSSSVGAGIFIPR